MGTTLEVGLKSCVTKRALFYLLFKNENTVFSEVTFRLSSARRVQPGHTVLWVGPVLLWPMTSSKRSEPQSKVWASIFKPIFGPFSITCPLITLFWNAGNAINTWHIATHCIAMHAKQACFSPVFWSEWNECCLYFPAKEQKTKAADFFPETLHGCFSPRRSSTCSSTRRLQCTTMTYV